MSRARDVANRDIVDGSIVNADISASAAIEQAKVSGLASHTSATSGVHGVTGNIVGTNDTQTLSNKALITPRESVLIGAYASGVVTFDILSVGAVVWSTVNATANMTPNLRGNSTTTFSSIVDVGRSITFVMLVPNGTTPYLVNGLQLDGVSQTIRWQGGVAPTSGNASSTDAYTFTIIKTDATPTYLVLGSQTRFA